MCTTEVLAEYRAASLASRRSGRRVPCNCKAHQQRQQHVQHIYIYTYAYYDRELKDIGCHAICGCCQVSTAESSPVSTDCGSPSAGRGRRQAGMSLAAPPRSCTRVYVYLNTYIYICTIAISYIYKRHDPCIYVYMYIYIYTYVYMCNI